MKQDIIIIGGGLGGMICGAILAKDGYKVTVLEQADKAGGSIQSYRRGVHRFDTGLHYVGGLAEGQPLHAAFADLGLLGLPWQRMDECFDLVLIGDHRYRLLQGWDHFLEELTREFPHQRRALQSYAARMRHVTQDDMEVNAWDYLHETFSDEMLINVVSAGAMKLELRRETLPLFNFAHAQSSYIDSSWRLRGDGDMITNHLQGIIEQNGGKVLTRKRVVQLVHDDKAVKKIITDDGAEYSADKVIADIHPKLLVELLDDNGRRTSRFIKRSIETVSTFGMFTASLVLKPQTIEYPNHNLYVYDAPDVWDFYRRGDGVTGVMISSRVPEDGDGYATQIDIMTPMLWEESCEWKSTTSGRRGQSYKDLCRRKAMQCVKLAERAIPGLGDAVETYYTSTPLTYRDYLMSPDGNAFGTRKDCSRSMLTYGTVRSPLQNLFLTGQSVCLPGIEGVTMTAYETCKVVKGL